MFYLIFAASVVFTTMLMNRHNFQFSNIWIKLITIGSVSFGLTVGAYMLMTFLIPTLIVLGIIVLGTIYFLS